MAKKINIKPSSKKYKKEVNDREEKGEEKLKKNKKKKLDKRRSRPKEKVIPKERSHNTYRKQKKKEKETNSKKSIPKIGNSNRKPEKKLSFSKREKQKENITKILSSTKKKLRSYVEEDKYIENDNMIMEKKKKKNVLFKTVNEQSKNKEKMTKEIEKDIQPEKNDEIKQKKIIEKKPEKTESVILKNPEDEKDKNKKEKQTKKAMNQIQKKKGKISKDNDASKGRILGTFIEKEKKEDKKLVKSQLTQKKMKNNNKIKKKIQIESGPKTILDIINDKKSGNPLPSSEEKIQKLLQKKRSSNKSSKTISQKNETSGSNLNSNSHYNKMFKPKVVLVDGKIQIEKPDIGLINKQINEEISKNALPLESYDENKRITSLSFKKLHHTNKWTDTDTMYFYKALSIFGLDFSFLEIVLKPRTRFEIKNKYLTEDRKHPEKIKKAIQAEKDLNQMIQILKLYKEEDREKSSYLNELTTEKKEKEEKLPFTYKDILLKKNIPLENNPNIQNIVNELAQHKTDDEEMHSKAESESKNEEDPKVGQNIKNNTKTNNEENEEDGDNEDLALNLEKEQLGQEKSDQKKNQQTEPTSNELQSQVKKEETIKKEQTKFVNDILKNFQN